MRLMNIENLDPEEVKKFDDLSEKWWDLNGDFKPLHQINPLRVNFIKERVDLEGKKVLDIGCGGRGGSCGDEALPSGILVSLPRVGDGNGSPSPRLAGGSKRELVPPRGCTRL